MANFAFPNSIYDKPTNLLSVLGSWWADNYGAIDQVESLVRGKCEVEQQSIIDMMELLSSLSRFTVPIYHVDNWYPLYLRESQRNAPELSKYRYDGTKQYDASIRYDSATPASYHKFPLDRAVIDFPLLVNQFISATLTLTNGVDYVLEDGAIVFLRNPITDPRVAKRNIYDGDEVVDTEAVLWAFRGKFDWDYVYKQFAYVFGIRLQSSPGYRNLMNAVFDAVGGGGTKKSITSAVSAITGIPLVKNAEEVIQDIVETNESVIVITDVEVYKYGANSTALFEIGDTVTRGQCITDAMRVVEFNTGDTPDDLLALAMGRGMLATCYFSDLLFENRDVPLHVNTQHPSGYTYVSWELGGFPMDVQKFFDDMHERGVAAALKPFDECVDSGIRYPANTCDETTYYGKKGTIAHLLDIRPNPTGEPTASQLPATINPLQFLITHVLRNNACLIRIRVDGGNHEGLGLHNLALLRKIVPPETAVILIMDMPKQNDTATITEPATPLGTFSGATPLSDTITTVEDTRNVIRGLNGTCY